MALEPCTECQNPFSSAASACPKCGHPRYEARPIQTWIRYVLMGVIAFGIVAILGATNSQAETRLANAAAGGAMVLMGSLGLGLTYVRRIF